MIDLSLTNLSASGPSAAGATEPVGEALDATPAASPFARALRALTGESDPEAEAADSEADADETQTISDLALTGVVVDVAPPAAPILPFSGGAAGEGVEGGEGNGRAEADAISLQASSAVLPTPATFASSAAAVPAGVSGQTPFLNQHAPAAGQTEGGATDAAEPVDALLSVGPTVPGAAASPATPGTASLSSTTPDGETVAVAVRPAPFPSIDSVGPEAPGVNQDPEGALGELQVPTPNRVAELVAHIGQGEAVDAEEAAASDTPVETTFVKQTSAPDSSDPPEGDTPALEHSSPNVVAFRAASGDSGWDARDGAAGGHGASFGFSGSHNAPHAFAGLKLASASFAAALANTPIEDTLPAETSAQIVQSLKLQWAKGGGEADIRLDPEHFGELRISLKVEARQVTARLEAEAPVVREWLQSNQAALRHSLADQNLTLERLEIVEPPRRDSRDADSREQRRDRESSSKRQSRRRREQGGELFEVVA